MRLWHVALPLGVFMGITMALYPYTTLIWLLLAVWIYVYSKKQINEVANSRARKYLKWVVTLTGSYIIAITTLLLALYGMRNFSAPAAAALIAAGVTTTLYIILNHTSPGKIFKALITPPKEPPEKEEIIFYYDDVYKITPRGENRYRMISFIDSKIVTLTWEEIYLYFKDRSLYELL